LKTSRLLLDTHIVVRWLDNPKKLTRDQRRALESAVKKSQTLAMSAATPLEIAMLVGDGRLRLKTSLDRFFADLRANPDFEVLPMTFEIALDAAHLGILRDPMDRAIAATARIHSFTLVTSDRRICNSALVPVLS
jgi:PIN domain nuclease of toxin-antitoxin system